MSKKQATKQAPATKQGTKGARTIAAPESMTAVSLAVAVIDKAVRGEAKALGALDLARTTLWAAIQEAGHCFGAVIEGVQRKLSGELARYYTEKGVYSEGSRAKQASLHAACIIGCAEFAIAPTQAPDPAKFTNAEDYAHAIRAMRKGQPVQTSDERKQARHQADAGNAPRDTGEGDKASAEATRAAALLAGLDVSFGGTVVRLLEWARVSEEARDALTMLGNDTRGARDAFVRAMGECLHSTQRTPISAPVRPAPTAGVVPASPAKLAQLRDKVNGSKPVRTSKAA